MNNNPFILALTEIDETERLFADYDLETSSYVSKKFFEDWFEDDDRASVEGIECAIQRDVIDEEPHCFEYGPLKFQRVQLNTLLEGGTIIEDPDFEVKKGAIVFEASERYTMGCDMAHVLVPIGYFSRRIDAPELAGCEWIERKLE